MGKTFWEKFSEEPFVDKFVGREDLLAIVDKAVADAPNNHVITFVGEGGIGKTALLRIIYKKYENRSDIISLKFDNTRSGLETFHAVQDQVIKQLQDDGLFTESDIKELKGINDPAQRALLEGKKEEEVNRLQQEANQKLAEYFNLAHKDSERRLLLISDSVDEVKESAFIQARDLSTSFHNAVLVWSGRAEPVVTERFKVFKDIYEGWNVHDISLDKFKIDETRAYFAKVLPVLDQPELIETIHILTAGKPILLAFMVEWFKHNVRLPDYLNQSKEELEALDEFHLEMLREDFELVLIRRVQAVRTPLEKALLFLSFLDRRYDKRILQLALKRPIEYIERLEADLRDTAFIRSFLDDSSGLLHDEAKRLIYQYAWPPYDPTHEDRDWLARMVIDGFYLPEIKRLRDEAAAILKEANGVPVDVSQEILAHELEMECLDYHYRISLDEGRRYVTKLIGEGISLRKREGIRHEITRRAGEAEADVAVARMNLRRGRFEENREVVEEALKEKELSRWYRMTLLYELSDAVIDPEEKAAYLKQAMRIAEQSQDQAAVAKIYNDLGLMYQRHSLWAEAEESLQIRLVLMDDPEQKAATLNSLALVKLLQGEIEQAKSLAGMALEMGETQGN